MPAEPGWRCTRCQQMKTRHKEDGVWFLCADGSIGKFRRLVTNPSRRAMSFNSTELRILRDILVGIQSGKDLTELVRHKAFITLSTKITGMCKKSLAAIGSQ